MVKALFFDIDGTLLSHRTGDVPASTRKALQLLHEQHILTFAATGRHITEIQELSMLHDLPLTGWITLNGQYCYNSEGVYYDNPIHQDDVMMMVKMMDELSFPCLMISADQAIINLHNDLLAKVQESIHTSLPPIGDIHALIKEPIYQMVPYGDDQLLTQLLEHMPHVKATKWHDLAMDFIPVDGGKNQGIKATCQHYGIPLNETMAFGDGDNDVDMLQFVGTGVAMGNSSKALLEVADYITEDIDDDGLYLALKHFSVI